MTTKLQTNAKYKPSGVDWLDNIPDGWDVRRMKFLFSLVKRPVRNEDEIITAFRDGTVTLRKNRREEGFTIALQESGYQGVREGDLVIHGMDGFAGAIGISESEGKATPVYSVCSPRNEGIVPSYYAYLLRTLALTGYIASLARGIRERSTEFKWNIVGNLSLILSPYETQKRIAEFLDEKTKVIDELMAKKEKLIEFLREKRAALITRAVTKGLDPNAELKSSGVDWLGDIPEGWKVERLKRISKIDTTGVWGDEPESCGNPVQVVSTPYVSSEGKIGGDLPLRCISSKELKYYSCREGDLLVVKSSGSATNVVTGKAGLVTKEYEGVYFSNFLLRIRPRTILAKYLHYFLNSYSVKDRIRMMVSTTTYPNLKLYEYRGFEIPIPSNEEQKQIADFLDAETGRIDKAVALIESQIEKLKEYRSTLIYHAVTGKIKV